MNEPETIREILENTSIDVLAEEVQANPERAGEAVQALMYYI